MLEQAVIIIDRGPEPRRVLLGLTLLERIIMTLGHEGIRRLLVLGGETGEPMPVRLSNDQELQRAGLELNWAAAGGMGAALPIPGIPFLLVRASVVFTSGLASWLHEFQPDGNALLVRSGDEDRHFRGLAICAAAIFPRLVDCLAGRGDECGLDTLFPPGIDDVMAVPPALGWVVMDSPQAVGPARALLRLSLGKPSDGFFSRHLNRRLSWPITRLLLRLGVKPNPVTLANLVLGLLSAWLIGRGGFSNALAAGVLFQFVSITDGCDGEIARLTFRFSALGASLDNLCDMIVLLAFFLNLPIGLYAATASVSYLFLGGFMLLLVAIFYLLLLVRIRLSGHRGNIAEIADKVQKKGGNNETPGRLERLGARLGFIFRKEFISLFSMVWCLFGRAEGILWTVTCLTPLGIIYEIDHIRRLKRR